MHDDGAPALPDTDELFEEVPVGLLVTDVRGGLLKVNETFCSWTGYAKAELVGRMKLQDLFTVGGRIFHHTHWLPMLQMQGSVSEVKFELCSRDGRTFTVMMNAVRRARGGGAFDEVSVSVAEERNKYERQLVFERKRADELALRRAEAQRVLQLAESRLRQAVRVADLHLWGVDASGRRGYDASVGALIGAEGLQAVDEARFVQAIVPEDRPLEEHAFRQALSEPDAVHRWAFRIRGADGGERHLVASGQAFLSADGALFQFVGVLRDVTEAVRQRADAEDRALFAEQMVAIVSHDLRNPLAAILMGAQLMSRAGELPPRQLRILDNVIRSSQRARRLIDELLDFTLARVGHGLAVSEKPLDLHELVAGCVDELRLSFPGRALKHVAMGSGPCTADPDRMAQLLGNLVANAATYGAADTPITVTSMIGADECRLSVHNDGVPIPTAMLASIFQPMVRGEAADPSVRSVGLGLFIVKAIAEAHQGQVGVTSNQQQGTTFTFTFPGSG